MVAQTSPSQHPLAHDVASQTQRPDAQRCPGAHEIPVPQRHAPAGPHVSASIGSQATQVEPPTPHVSGLRTRHSAPSQHPDGQLIASQTHRPLTQR